MAKVTIVNKKGVTMTVPEKMAAALGGVKPKILEKPPELISAPIPPKEVVEVEAAPKEEVAPIAPKEEVAPVKEVTDPNKPVAKKRPPAKKRKR
jgi:hypothetical protein